MNWLDEEIATKGGVGSVEDRWYERIDGRKQGGKTLAGQRLAGGFKVESGSLSRL